jgi:hypothetical protein
MHDLIIVSILSYHSRLSGRKFGLVVLQDLFEGAMIAI